MLKQLFLGHTGTRRYLIYFGLDPDPCIFSWILMQENDEDHADPHFDISNTRIATLKINKIGY